MLLITVPEICDVEYLLSKVKYKKVCETNYEIYNCEYKGTEFFILITGYGKVNIGSSLQNALDIIDDNICVVQIGTAGSLTSKCSIFDAFVVDKTLQFDINFTKLGCNMATLPNEKTGTYNSNFYLKKCLINSISECDKNYIEGIMATSDSFVCSCNMNSYLQKKFCAKAIDTECASTAQFCFNNKIPFAGLKVISNYVNDNGINQYKIYNEEASFLCQKIMLNFIKNFSN